MTLSIRRGDTPTVRSRRLKIGGAIVSLENKTITLTVKASVDDPDESALLQKTYLGGSDADSLAGIAVFQLSAAETDLTIGAHFYDIQVAWDSSVHTPQSGIFMVHRDIGLAADILPPAEPAPSAAITKMGLMGVAMAA